MCFLSFFVVVPLVFHWFPLFVRSGDGMSPKDKSTVVSAGSFLMVSFFDLGLDFWQMSTSESNLSMQNYVCSHSEMCGGRGSGT